MTCSVEIIADTIGDRGARITTFQVYAPRFLLAEVNTHGVIAKSAASSRAIPVKKRIEMVEKDPYIPATWGKNQRGMQADDVLDTAAADAAETEWRNAIHAATFRAGKLAEIDLHKQFANRVLEPFSHYLGVMTATEWDNFFALRTSPSAQPEFQELAKLMQAAYADSKPADRFYHLPYTGDMLETGLHNIKTLFQVSAARCARVSYNTFEGRESTVEEDVALCDKLLAEGHMSPFDHQAYRDYVVQKRWHQPELHGRFWGWIPYRRFVERDLGLITRRNSFAEVDNG